MTQTKSGREGRTEMTIPAYDIFRAEADGAVLWLESATTIDEARARAQELAANSPGEYFILSHRTGNKLGIEPSSSSLSSALPGAEEA
jgi:hypothetical protein